jgi:hypothetical protein
VIAERTGAQQLGSALPRGKRFLQRPCRALVVEIFDLTL